MAVDTRWPIHKIPLLRAALINDEMEVQSAGGGVSARVTAASVAALGGTVGPPGPPGPAQMPTPYDFGAVGDGVADDSAAMQAWLDAIPVMGGGGYGKAGTFLVKASPGDAPLKIGGGTTIFGAGKDKFIIKCDPNVAQNFGIIFNKNFILPGGIYGLTINNPGSGFAPGDAATVNQGSESGAQIFVDTVDGSGGLTGIRIIVNHDGYTTATNVPLVATVGGGTGATVDIVAQPTVPRVDKDIAIYGTCFQGDHTQLSTPDEFAVFIGVDGLIIRDCLFKDRTWNALDLSNNNNVTIDNNEFANIGDPTPYDVITGIVPLVPGTGFAVNDVGYVFQTNPNTATYIVDSVSGGGAITALHITNSGYSADYFSGPATLVPTSGAGTGATVTLTCKHGTFNGGVVIFFLTPNFNIRVTNNYLHDLTGALGIWMDGNGIGAVCTGNIILGATEAGIVGAPTGGIVSGNVVIGVILKDVSGHGAEMSGSNYIFNNNFFSFCPHTCSVFTNVQNVTICGNIFNLPNQSEEAINGALAILSTGNNGEGGFPPSNIMISGNMISAADGKGRSAFVFSNLSGDPTRTMASVHVVGNNCGPISRWPQGTVYFFPDAESVLGDSFVHRDNNGSLDMDPWSFNLFIPSGSSGTIAATGVPFKPRTLDLNTVFPPGAILSQCIGNVDPVLNNVSNSLAVDATGAFSTTGFGIKLYDGSQNLLVDAAVTSYTTDGFVVTINGTTTN
ncbi:MAG TPA: glycosyl hydrolase family 28-related protein, partial [Pseudolabrys sp.]|nr:glycosyl hydrolase family 28-related protein [Pseudolabrys sp.]